MILLIDNYDSFVRSLPSTSLARISFIYDILLFYSLFRYISFNSFLNVLQ